MSSELFPFRYRDPLTGKWTAARYKASRDDIAKRYAVWEITGPGETPIDHYGTGYGHLYVRPKKPAGPDG